MKKFLNVITTIVEYICIAISTTAGLAIMVAICCLDGAPIPCMLVIITSLIWFGFRVWLWDRRFKRGGAEK